MAAAKSLSKRLPGKDLVGVAGAVELELVDAIFVNHVQADIAESSDSIWARTRRVRLR